MAKLFSMFNSIIISNIFVLFDELFWKNLLERNMMVGGKFAAGSYILIDEFLSNI